MQERIDEQTAQYQAQKLDQAHTQLETTQAELERLVRSLAQVGLDKAQVEHELAAAQEELAYQEAQRQELRQRVSDLEGQLRVSGLDYQNAMRQVQDGKRVADALRADLEDAQAQVQRLTVTDTEHAAAIYEAKVAKEQAEVLAGLAEQRRLEWATANAQVEMLSHSLDAATKLYQETVEAQESKLALIVNWADEQGMLPEHTFTWPDGTVTEADPR